MSKKTLKKRILSSKLLFIVMLIILIFIIFALSKEIIRRHQIDKEIESMQKEVEKLEDKNNELSNLTDYYNTEAFKEKEARKKLGLVKEGEKSVALPESRKNTTSEESIKEQEQKSNLTNSQKWWNYFFANK